MSTATGSTGPRVYRGLNLKEGMGWIAGMTPVQAFLVAAACTPALIAMSRNQWSTAFGWAVFAAVLVVLIVVPVHGRPAFRWLADLIMFQTGVLMRWSPWQSRAAAGLVGDRNEPDLPGVLSRLEFPDGPEFHGSRICLIHDTDQGRWGATARLTHSGVGMLSDDECEELARRLGSMLVGLGHREVVDRISLLVRTVPDDGTEYAVWRERHQRSDAPTLAHRVTAEIDRDVASVSVRTELFVTVSGTEDALRRPAKAAGGGVAGRAYALYRVLEAVADGLRGLGVTSVTWLTSTGVAEAIKTGFNPATAASLQYQHLVRPDPDGSVGLPIPRPDRPSLPRRPPGPITTTGSPRSPTPCSPRSPGRSSGPSARCSQSAPQASAAPCRSTTRSCPRPPPPGRCAHSGSATTSWSTRRPSVASTPPPSTPAASPEHVSRKPPSPPGTPWSASPWPPRSRCPPSGTSRTTPPGWRTTPRAGSACCAWSWPRIPRSSPRPSRSGSGCPG